MRTETDKDNDLTGQVDWDGTGLPPVGVDCVFYPDNTCWGFEHVKPYKGKVLCYEGEQFVFMLDHKLYGIKPESIILSRTDKGDFQKPEVPKQREVCERIEAAYALYCESLIGEDEETVSFDEFKEFKNRLRQWLRIVDKTGYRINKDGE
ncbi:TPA: hypothetical protein ACMDTO_000156 [Vibrio cholerae]|uniref:hypothetical protein n=1 Tax=Vibrio cholerae TaxID=666 RepID=UPI001D64F106|nr:hypothetical protein [Vibrio cholerae]EGR4280991.1 hypothetical protein [Vibrio cholerae]